MFLLDALKAAVPATTGYFTWGCFRYFSFGAQTVPGLRLSFPMMIAGWLASP
jgi:hypothetical protein